MKPPTIFELLSDPIYRAYVKRVPSAHPLLEHGDPWQVWARFTDGKWRTGLFSTYADAWRVLVKYYRRDQITPVEDIALVSRRVFYGPPGEWRKVRVRVPAKGNQPATTRIEERWYSTYHWDAGLEWCGRCRRPTVYRKLHPSHHALKRQPCLAEDEPLRCMYCGMRRAGAPSLDMMEY
jgi:hypothetical protein